MMTTHSLAPYLSPYTEGDEAHLSTCTPTSRASLATVPVSILCLVDSFCLPDAHVALKCVNGRFYATLWQLPSPYWYREARRSAIAWISRLPPSVTLHPTFKVGGNSLGPSQTKNRNRSIRDFTVTSSLRRNDRCSCSRRGGGEGTSDDGGASTCGSTATTSTRALHYREVVNSFRTQSNKATCTSQRTRNNAAASITSPFAQSLSASTNSSSCVVGGNSSINSTLSVFNRSSRSAGEKEKGRAIGVGLGGLGGLGTPHNNELFGGDPYQFTSIGGGRQPYNHYFDAMSTTTDHFLDAAGVLDVVVSSSSDPSAMGTDIGGDPLCPPTSHLGGACYHRFSSGGSGVTSARLPTFTSSTYAFGAANSGGSGIGGGRTVARRRCRSPDGESLCVLIHLLCANPTIDEDVLRSAMGAGAGAGSNTAPTTTTSTSAARRTDNILNHVEETSYTEHGGPASAPAPPRVDYGGVSYAVTAGSHQGLSTNTFVAVGSSSERAKATKRADKSIINSTSTTPQHQIMSNFYPEMETYGKRDKIVVNWGSALPPPPLSAVVGSSALQVDSVVEKSSIEPGEAAPPVDTQQRDEDNLNKVKKRAALEDARRREAEQALAKRIADATPYFNGDEPLMPMPRRPNADDLRKTTGNCANSTSAGGGGSGANTIEWLQRWSSSVSSPAEEVVRLFGVGLVHVHGHSSSSTHLPSNNDDADAKADEAENAVIPRFVVSFGVGGMGVEPALSSVKGLCLATVYEGTPEGWGGPRRSDAIGRFWHLDTSAADNELQLLCPTHVENAKEAVITSHPRVLQHLRVLDRPYASPVPMYAAKPVRIGLTLEERLLRSLLVFASGGYYEKQRGVVSGGSLGGGGGKPHSTPLLTTKSRASSEPPVPSLLVSSSAAVITSAGGGCSTNSGGVAGSLSGSAAMALRRRREAGASTTASKQSTPIPTPSPLPLLPPPPPISEASLATSPSSSSALLLLSSSSSPPPPPPIATITVRDYGKAEITSATTPSTTTGADADSSGVVGVGVTRGAAFTCGDENENEKRVPNRQLVGTNVCEKHEDEEEDEGDLDMDTLYDEAAADEDEATQPVPTDVTELFLQEFLDPITEAVKELEHSSHTAKQLQKQKMMIMTKAATATATASSSPPRIMGIRGRLAGGRQLLRHLVEEEEEEQPQHGEQQQYLEQQKLYARGKGGGEAGGEEEEATIRVPSRDTSSSSSSRNESGNAATITTNASSDRLLPSEGRVLRRAVGVGFGCSVSLMSAEASSSTAATTNAPSSTPHSPNILPSHSLMPLSSPNRKQQQHSSTSSPLSNSNTVTRLHRHGHIGEAVVGSNTNTNDDEDDDDDDEGDLTLGETSTSSSGSSTSPSCSSPLPPSSTGASPFSSYSTARAKERDAARDFTSTYASNKNGEGAKKEEGDVSMSTNEGGRAPPRRRTAHDHHHNDITYINNNNDGDGDEEGSMDIVSLQEVIIDLTTPKGIWKCSKGVGVVTVVPDPLATWLRRKEQLRQWSKRYLSRILEFIVVVGGFPSNMIPKGPIEVNYRF